MTGGLSRRRLLALAATAGVGGLAGCGYRPGGGDFRWTVETGTGPFQPDDVLATGGTRRSPARETGQSPARGTVFTVNRSRRGYDFDTEEWGENAEITAYDPASGDERWTETTRPCGRPAVHDGTLYLGHEDGGLTALDADGSVGWRASLDGFPRRFAVAGDRVYALTDAGDLAAVATADGQHRWQTSVGSEAGKMLAATPDGVVVVRAGGDEAASTASTAVTAFRTDGEEQWTAELSGDSVEARPVVTEDAVVVATDRSLVVLARHDGSRRWSQSVGYLRGRPAVADGTVYYGTGGALVAREVDGGDRRWRFGDARGSPGSPAVAGGTVYAADDELLRALSAADGSARWTVETASVHSGPLVVGDTVVVATHEGVVRGHRRE